MICIKSFANRVVSVWSSSLNSVCLSCLSVCLVNPVPKSRMEGHRKLRIGRAMGDSGDP